MLNIPIEEIGASISKTTQYHIKMESTIGGLIQEGDIDEASQSLHLQIGFMKEGCPITEIKRLGNAGHARPIGSEKWDRIKVTGKFPAYLKCALDILKKGKVTSVEDQGTTLMADILMEDLPLLKDPDTFYTSIYKELGIKDDRILRKMMLLGKELSISTRFWINKKDYKIDKISVLISTPEGKSETITKFSSIISKIQPVKAEEINKSSINKSLSSLMFRMPSIGGWPVIIHRDWATKSINLIGELDADSQYSSIYAKYWMDYDYRSIFLHDPEDRLPHTDAVLHN